MLNSVVKTFPSGRKRLMMESEQQIKEKSPLRLLREDAGLTRPQVKQLIGISERRQADWEAGKAMPSAENLIALARLYKVSLKTICQAMGLDTSDIPDDQPLMPATNGKTRRRSQN